MPDRFMKHRQPIRTEYRGIVFRSKSEAIFARALDLSGSSVWAYETDFPYEIETDFFIMGRHLSGSFEYKPSCPTETYVENWMSKMMNAIISHDQYLDHMPSFGIIYGNAFEGRGELKFIGNESEKGAVTHNLPRRADMLNARSFRFDLKHH